MDAGLAAVLGATVGAVGTGGAGIVAALLTRSQARSQLSAEYARFIREPRKTAYTAYAEAALRDHSLLTDAGMSLTLAEGAEGARKAEHITQARAAYETVATNDADLEHRYAQVAVEGPRTITSITVKLSGALAEFRGHVMICLLAFEQQGSCSSDAIELLEKEREKSYDAYLDFLRTASEVLGADGIRRFHE
ncbi:hypothetical protein ABZ016_31000 [Streptomyces sp. NPDC006372]|uniref:hypothetical protein n=1 Tax=Streptomyces sp. NPDC006372 TaxID=3155599 RepID=UPI0033AF21A9